MKILIADDVATSRMILRAKLEAQGHDVRAAADGVEALQILDREEVDAIISDVLMPNMDGYILCREVRSSAKNPHLPFIIYTSTYTELSDEELALDLGADFFLRKPAPVEIILKALEAILNRRPQHSVPPVPPRDIMGQYSQALVRKLEKRNEELSARTAELFASETRLRSIFETEPDGVVVFGRDGIITEINHAGLEFFGSASLEAMSERRITHLVMTDHWEAFQIAMSAGWAGSKSSVEFEVAPVTSERRWLEMHAAPLRNSEGTITALLGILRDNTERKELEAQFVQAQKMEVVGHLAGGIAHDFNNMLAIIMGYAEIALNEISSGTPQHKHIQTVYDTAGRAAALTRQLLIFSRKQAVQAQVLDLSELLVGIDPMLRRLIGENINLETVPEPGLRRVEADPGQIEQVLMNLTVNARDAMPNGGNLTLATANFTAQAQALPHPEMTPGEYVMFSVADEGTGMSEAVKVKIFEAFFTTKAAGKGTGLGLATCHSIVKQWHGYITVQSELGHGTTFTVYLPQATNGREAVATAAETGAPPRGDETLLLVEDEPGLRELAAAILSKQGYTVLKAGNGQEALRVVREARLRPIDLVVSDMVMPEMGGPMMAEWLRATNPEIKVLFTSGYFDCGIDGTLEEGIEFLPKPYTPSSLARKVREVLDKQGQTATVGAGGGTLSSGARGLNNAGAEAAAPVRLA